MCDDSVLLRLIDGTGLQQQERATMPTNITQNMALQSYCLRGFKDNEEVASKVKECGLSAIELCGVHCNFADESQWESVINTYRNAGIRIVSVGVEGLRAEEDRERKIFSFAKEAGCTTISVTFDADKAPDCYRVAEKLADEFDINLGIHNHGRNHWLGSSAALESVFQQTSSRIGLMIDTAWTLDSREDPIAWVERFADRLVGVHLKDFSFDAEGAHKDVIVGTGNLDLPKLFLGLNKAQFDGQMILEYEGDVDNPVPTLRECITAIRNT